MEQLIDEFITKYVFPQFRECNHPSYPEDRYFIIGDDEYPIAMMSRFDEHLIIHPKKWGIVMSMFSLTEDETVVVIKRWLNMNIPLLSFDRINLMKYP
jgi:hypothetical protein